MTEKKLWLRESVCTGRTGILAGSSRRHLVRAKSDIPGTAHPPVKRKQASLLRLGRCVIVYQNTAPRMCRTCSTCSAGREASSGCAVQHGAATTSPVHCIRLYDSFKRCIVKCNAEIQRRAWRTMSPLRVIVHKGHITALSDPASPSQSQFFSWFGILSFLKLRGVWLTMGAWGAWGAAGMHPRCRC